MSIGLREELEREARAAGFSAFGVTTPGAMAAETAPALARFLEEGMHGEMGWMAERSAWRADPRALWPEARSVIMLGENYGPEAAPMALARSCSVKRTRSMLAGFSGSSVVIVSRA